MSGFTVDSLTQAILAGWHSEGLPGVEPYMTKLAKGIAKGVYQEMMIYGGIHVCPAIDVYVPPAP